MVRSLLSSFHCSSRLVLGLASVAKQWGPESKKLCATGSGISKASHRNGSLCWEGGVPVTALPGRTFWQEGVGISQRGRCIIRSMALALLKLEGCLKMSTGLSLHCF